MQSGGPHVGMLNDILRTARLEWKDIQVVWTEDVTGDKGPAALFRKDASIDVKKIANDPEVKKAQGELKAAFKDLGASVKDAAKKNKHGHEAGNSTGSDDNG